MREDLLVFEGCKLTSSARYQARLFSRVWLESKNLVQHIPERLQKQYIVLP